MSNVFDIDLDNVEQLKDRSPVKPGPQRIRVASVEGGESPEKKTPYLRVVHEYVSTDALVPMTAGLEVQTQVRRDLYLSQGALPFVRQFAEGHGLTWDDFKETLKPIVEYIRNGDIDGFKAYVKDVMEGQLQGLEADARIDLTPSKNDPEKKYNQIGKYIIS